MGGGSIVICESSLATVVALVFAVSRAHFLWGRSFDRDIQYLSPGWFNIAIRRNRVYFWLMLKGDTVGTLCQ